MYNYYYENERNADKFAKTGSAEKTKILFEQYNYQFICE